MKFYGKVGFRSTVEIRPGNCQEQITERTYMGEVFRNVKRKTDGESNGSTVSGIRYNNQISIVADEYAFGNFYDILYVEWNGAKFSVESVTVEHPRLTLEIGGVYHEYDT